MMLRNCWIRHLRFAPLLLAGAVGVTACDFQVVNPGRIMEEDLNSDAAVEALVTGMSADFSEEYDGVAFIVARASDDMAGSGSYNTTNFFRQGIIFNDEIQGEWEGTQRARWVAEDGLRRMQEEMEGYEFGGDEPTARAYLLAGLANRVVAEAFCNSTVSANAPLGGVPGGEGALSTDEAFQRAANFLAEAITHGTTAGEQDIVDAARGGRAQAYVGLGDWANAVLEARQVATDFVYEAIYSNNTDREENEIREETHQREEMSVYDTYIATIDPPDPRAPYTNCPADPDACSDVVKGADGITPYWRQEKYPDKGSNMAVVKGTDDLTPAPATLDEGWIALDHERHLTLWMEGRRLHDLRRWNEENRTIMPAVQFLRGEIIIAGDNMYPGLSIRESCIPIGFSVGAAKDVPTGSAGGDGLFWSSVDRYVRVQRYVAGVIEKPLTHREVIGSALKVFNPRLVTERIDPRYAAALLRLQSDAKRQGNPLPQGFGLEVLGLGQTRCLDPASDSDGSNTTHRSIRWK